MRGAVGHSTFAPNGEFYGLPAVGTLGLRSVVGGKRTFTNSNGLLLFPDPNVGLLLFPDPIVVLLLLLTL